MIVINEGINYDPYKKDLVKDKNGKITDGWGNSYRVNRSKSDVIKYKDYNFQYDYNRKILTMKYENKFVHDEFIDLYEWIDNPEYFIEDMFDKFENTIVVG